MADLKKMTDLEKRPVVVDEVILKRTQTVTGLVQVEDTLVLGTILTTKDGGASWSALTTPEYTQNVYGVDDKIFFDGVIWISLEDNNISKPSKDNIQWEKVEEFDANGVLLENLTQTTNAAVLVTGEVREKYLQKFDVSMKISLFKNKIILR